MPRSDDFALYLMELQTTLRQMREAKLSPIDRAELILEMSKTTELWLKERELNG